MIGVTLILQSKPDQADAMAAFWVEGARRVRAEDPGCRLLHVQRNATDPTQFVVFEVYGSQAELDAHNASELSKQLLPQLIPLLAGPPQVINGPIVV